MKMNFLSAIKVFLLCAMLSACGQPEETVKVKIRFGQSDEALAQNLFTTTNPSSCPIQFLRISAYESGAVVESNGMQIEAKIDFPGIGVTGGPQTVSLSVPRGQVFFELKGVIRVQWDSTNHKHACENSTSDLRILPSGGYSQVFPIYGKATANVNEANQEIQLNAKLLFNNTGPTAQGIFVSSNSATVVNDFQVFPFTHPCSGTAPVVSQVWYQPEVGAVNPIYISVPGVSTITNNSTYLSGIFPGPNRVFVKCTTANPDSCYEITRGSNGAANGAIPICPNALSSL